MTDKFYRKDNPEAFIELAKQCGIEYSSQVDHFRRDALGMYQPVMCWEISQENTSATERTLR